MNDKQKAICQDAIESLQDAIWMVEGLIAIKEITHWKDQGLTDKEIAALEWMIQPVTKHIHSDLAAALDGMTELNTQTIADTKAAPAA